MSEKLCPMRFREFTSNPDDQACIGERCMLWWKCEESKTHQNVSADDTGEDSREKLEADMASILQSAYMFAWMHGHENRRGCSFSHLHSDFYNLLDRQAAITGREIAEGESNPYYPTMWEELCYVRKRNHELQAKVDELERDNARLLAKVRELRDLLEDVEHDRDSLQAAYDELTAIAAQLCRACGFSMVDAAGEVVS